MKILAIRGKNLASLAGSFAVELDRPPLQGAGLYCISGPTGAGKSTLLDAMCAALFDQTPRLAGKSDVRLEDIGNSDVRNLLRRGASSGHAEVDFVGVDGRRYRARWCVRRARERADGAFQPQELKLQDLYSGEMLGGTKSETLAVIQEKLGLSFDQFRRAVLLAQGDFAAFLKAKAGERAELLERMTGTDLYRKISRAAFERAREAGQGLADLQRQLEGIDLLPPEIRDGLDAEIARLDADVQGERLHEAEAAVAVAWHKALAGLAAAQRAAEETLEAARSAEQAAEVERREVAAVEEALPLRPLLMALDTARTAAERAAQAQRSSADETLAARGAEAGASQGRGAALHEQGRATQARADAEPSLVEASRLDGLIARAQADFEKVDGEAAEASRVAAGARAEAARCGQEVAGLQARRDRARGWLDGHADLSALGDEWGRWRAVLERATSAEARAVEVRGKRPGLERALKKALAGAEGAAVARSIAAAALDEAIRVQTEAEALAVQHPLAPLRAERQSLLIRLEALRNLKGTAKLAATAAEDETRQRAAALHAREEAANCRATAEEARRLAGLVGERLEEADRALRLARTSQDVAGYRADLRAGEHCPLCGATEHPWAAHESPLAALVQEQASRVAALQAERGEASERAAGADAQAVEREKAALACLQAAERAAALVAGEQAAWRAERMTYRRVAGGRLSHAAVGASRGSAGLYEDVPRAGMMAVGDIPPVEEAVARKADVQPDVEAFPEDVLAPEALPVVEALAGAARDHLRGIEAAEHAAEQAQQALHEAARHVQLAQGRLNTAGDALVRAEADARAAGDALQAVDREMASLSEIFDAACHELQAAFLGRGDWEARLRGAPAAFASACEAEARDWLRARKAGEEATLQLAALLPRAAALDAEARAREEQVAILAGRRAAEASACGALRAARAQHFEGRAVDAARAELDARVTSAATALDAVEVAWRAARERVAAAAARESAADETFAESAAALARETRSLEAALGPLDVAALRALLAHGDDWLHARRRTLARLAEEVRRSATVLEERRRQREAHENGEAPRLPADEATARLGQAREALQAAEKALIERRRDLAVDDDRLRHARALQESLSERRARAAVWQNLNELIGSADGKKFQVFAQSLTLDALLAYANEHLRDLAPRYRLMRVPGHDLDLQVVDRDMGDEARTINGLSGGETFLVSLSLALGLSSLSAERIQVESLFVDEGFGTLDPDTLEGALATLDALQASGRQVGLISHVPGLAERIGARIEVVPQGAGRSVVRC